MKWLLKSNIAKILLGNFLIVIIPLTSLSLFINNMSAKIIQQQVNKSYTNSLNLLSKQLYNRLENCAAIVNALVNDENILALNQSPPGTVSWEYINTFNKLKFVQSTNELENHIKIYLRNKQRVFSSLYGLNVIKNPDLLDLQYNNYTIAKWIFKKTFEDKKEKLILTYSQVPYYYNSNNNLIGVIEIDTNHIKKILNNFDVHGSGLAFLIDSKNNCISPNNIRQNIHLNAVQNKIINDNKSHGTLTYSEASNNYTIIYSSIGTNDLILGMYFTQKEFMKPILTIQRMLIIIVIFSILLAIYFTFSSYKKLLFPIHKLVNGMEIVSNGNFDIQIENHEKNEIGFIFDQFNYMVTKIHSLINEVYKHKINYQQSQLKLLQSQINPHFLYNCLNSVYQMSILEDTEGAAQMALYLGKYFRYATKSDKNLVTIQAEIENIKSYVAIQQMRYQGKIFLNINIDKEINNIIIPRLIIQPLVENSIIHGIEQIKGNCHIMITGYKKNNLILISVEDNGIGITSAKAEKLNLTMEELKLEQTGHALNNTHWRLKLKFGNTAGLYIEPRMPNGTRVTITIPCI